MNVVLTSHARNRMRRRRVDLAHITSALCNCYDHKPGDEQGVCHWGYGALTDTLKVWTPPMSTAMPHSGTIVIKSVAWKGR